MHTGSSSSWPGSHSESMTVTGYSDVINHAFAFAAKHHDRQVRKGTKLPYLTHPANVAVILTRYGCDNDTVVAGNFPHLNQGCVPGGGLRHMLGKRKEDENLAKNLDKIIR